jgi:hypothetical protein
MLTCPDCKGRKKLFALVDGPDYRGGAEIDCIRCKGSGEVDECMERWMKIGGTHRTWRVAQHVSLAECAAKLGLTPADLSGMENGRRDPTRLIAAIPIELQPRL